MSFDGKYTVLIGSYARGTQRYESDIDIIRINHEDDALIDSSWNRDSISYIDFDSKQFSDLYQIGSLLLHHTFSEGILLEGNSQLWNDFSRRFVVTSDPACTIDGYASLIAHINSHRDFAKAFVAYLSNYFKASKNIGIFKQAAAGNYCYEKLNALVIGCHMPLEEAEMLIRANDLFDRGIGPANDTSQLEELAERLFREGKDRLKDILK